MSTTEPDSIAEVDLNPFDPFIEAVGTAIESALTQRGSPYGPNRPGRCHCLRCGWHWNPHARNPNPKSCPLCHSSYWDRPPQRVYARRPENTDWAEVNRSIASKTEERNHRKRLKRLRSEAAKMGLEVREPKHRERKSQGPKMKIVEAAQAESTVAVAVATPPPSPAPVVRVRAHGRTVPPPPSSSDLTDPNPQSKG